MRSRSPPTALVVGKGIVDYSASELSRVIGMKSAEVRELLPTQQMRSFTETASCLVGLRHQLPSYP